MYWTMKINGNWILKYWWNLLETNLILITAIFRFLTDILVMAKYYIFVKRVDKISLQDCSLIWSKTL